MSFFPNSILNKAGGMILILFFLSGCGTENQLEKVQFDIYRVIEKVGPSIVSIQALNKAKGETRFGSGVALEKNFILTTENLLQNSDELKIMLQDGTSIPDSEIAGLYCDFETNVSLIKLKRENLKPVKLAEKEKVRNGTLGLIIGNTTYSKGLQVHLGTIGSSWIGGVDPYDQELLVLSVPSSNYQTGTPIFNSEGKLIGLYEGKLEGKENIILVLPASTCNLVVKILKENGEVKRGWIGVFTQKRCAREIALEPKEGGVLVTEVYAGSPAFKAGVKKGDLIISCEGEKIKDESEFRKMVSKSPFGTKLKLLLLRQGNKIEKEIIVESSKNMPISRRCPNRSI